VLLLVTLLRISVLTLTYEFLAVDLPGTAESTTEPRA
jgi:hypothetical protein